MKKRCRRIVICTDWQAKRDVPQIRAWNDGMVEVKDSLGWRPSYNLDPTLTHDHIAPLMVAVSRLAKKLARKAPPK